MDRLFGDPLVRLGLAADADERAVKRAYAARLKSVRPEDDPEGFARLVALRDAALRLVRQRAAEAEAMAAADARPETDPATTETFRFRPVDVAALARLAAAFPTPAAGAPATMGADAPLANPVADPAAEPADVPDAAPALSAPAVLPSPSPPPPAPAIPPAPADDPLAPVDTVPATLRLDRAVAMADALIAGPTPADGDGWRVVFDLADSLPLALRGALENRLAEVINRALPDLLGRDDGAAAATWIVSRVGEDFGWLKATRRVAGLFWPPDGRQALPQFIEKLLSRVPPPGRDENGLPLIDRFDLEAFFGSSEHRTARYYERARRRGRFGLSWTTLAFLSPPAWAAFRGWYTAAAAMITGALLLRPWLPDVDESVGGSVLMLAALALMAAGHVAAALLADRLAIARLVWHRKGADRASPYRDEARRRFLAQKVQTSRGTAVFAGLLFFYIADINLLLALIEGVLLLARAAP